MVREFDAEIAKENSHISNNQKKATETNEINNEACNNLDKQQVIQFIQFKQYSK